MFGLMGVARMSGQPGGPFSSLSLPVDYWVDAATGSDANDGLTAGAAWASLSKITQALIATGETKTARVKSGTYDTALDYLSVALVAQTGTTFNVVFEPGCVIDGTAYTVQNGVSYSSAATGGGGNVFNAYGNGCVIQNVLTADGNGLDGYGEAAVANFYDFEVVNCRDGLSMHFAIVANFYDISVRDCVKYAAAQVGTSIVSHYRCSFSDANETALGLVKTEQAGGTLFQDCEFLPGTTYDSSTIVCLNGLATFQNCRLGTVSRKVELNPFASGASALVQDSFVNVFCDGFYRPTTFERCFGKLSARMGAGGGPLTVTNCVISGPATGNSSVFYSTYNPGSSGQWLVRDNIFETATAAAFMDLDATNAGYLVAADSEFFNNILSGSAAIDADLVTADAGGVVVVDNVTADALIGAANTMNPDDYGYAAGSPAIGAATAGGNCGFAVGEVAAMAGG